MGFRYHFFLILAFLMTLVSCKKDNQEFIDCSNNSGKLFSLLGTNETHIDFINTLNYSEQFNTYTYRNYYNGGGVGIGDINNDGLPDLFFCGNMVSNRLYLNSGNLEFRDITDQAMVNSSGAWTTGVSIADVNGDGWLDIFITKSGIPEGNNRKNELLINSGILDEQGIPVFTDMASQYGIDDLGFSNHAAFFDYDKDGDLDMYLLNNSIKSVGDYDLNEGQRLVRDSDGSNKLYRNDGDIFSDVSESAGIYGSVVGFGLGVSIGDVNKDGWQDIYISNDFFEKDYLYINNRDGTFTESLEEVIGEISLGSMGADMADINNDGFPEIFVTEMLPNDNERLKTKAVFETWERYQKGLKAGYFRQFPRNTLQLNNGYHGGGHTVSMSEIGRFAGVEATDWSWGALIADLDNDGLKDLFVANGVFKDLLDLDYINFLADPLTTKRMFEERGSFLKELIDKIPSNPISNYAFKNQGDLTFSNQASEWGLDCKSFSNGSAYGDLDNDGDLDLIVNNVNMAPFIYRNNSEKLYPENHFVSIRLKGEDKNTDALGSQVSVYTEGELFYQELAPMRGFQSTVDNRLFFGLGKHQQIDSLIINWSDLSSTILYDLPANQFITVSYSEFNHNSIKVDSNKRTTNNPFLTEVTNEFNFNYPYEKSDFVDFTRDPLLFHMASAEGSVIRTADVNGDKLDDIYIGGSKGKPAQLYIQTLDGKFQESLVQSFANDKMSNDTDAIFFDADNDGDNDLYVCSGGNEFPSSSSSLSDRLYFNDGGDKFTRSAQVLPAGNYENTSVVKSADYDKDGDIDLFVGVRALPFAYGVPGNGYLLQNNGKGEFMNVTEELAPQLLNLGLITDAQWLDFDKDQDLDLVIVGEWMPITLFENNNGRFINATSKAGLEKTNGFWNCLEVVDIDGDNDLDLVGGNLGLNTRLKASVEKPVSMYVHDFDQNGKIEQIITAFNGPESYTVSGREDLVDQIPSLKSKYPNYNSFKSQSIHDIFGTDILEKAEQFSAFNTASACFINNDGVFTMNALPTEAQFAPVYSIIVDDFNGDQIPDLLLGGNFHWAKPQVGIYDASRGNLLLGGGNATFNTLTSNESGLFISGEIRDFSRLLINGKQYVMVSRINEKPLVLQMNK